MSFNKIGNEEIKNYQTSLACIQWIIYQKKLLWKMETAAVAIQYVKTLETSEDITFLKKIMVHFKLAKTSQRI